MSGTKARVIYSPNDDFLVGNEFAWGHFLTLLKNSDLPSGLKIMRVADVDSLTVHGRDLVDNDRNIYALTTCPSAPCGLQAKKLRGKYTGAL